MNFVFFSVHFPAFNTEFSYHLRNYGANVLGIGDTGYHNLKDRLKSSLTDYYQVSSLENYDEVLRAVGYFTHKYGKIDRFESMNEHWLELEARIRTDFNIDGIKADMVQEIRRKSRMKYYFEKSGVGMIPFIDKLDRNKVASFARRHGYPVIIKPDKGSGAALTFKISDRGELGTFFEQAPTDIDFIAEAFIDGTIVTYDGLVDHAGKILFESTTFYEQSIMDVVNYDDHVYYVTLPSIPDDVRQAGHRIINEFPVRERFFHLEMFRERNSGQLMALEVNMRPPGAWMTDSINFTHDMDIYREWANMVVNGRVEAPSRGKYYTAYASRKDHKHYLHDHQEIIRRLQNKLVKFEPIEPIFSRAMGNYAYQFRSESLEEVKKFIGFVQEETHS